MSSLKKIDSICLCPNCESVNVVVIDSRPTEKYNCYTIRRRRKCVACKYRFTTYELPSDLIDEVFNFIKLTKTTITQLNSLSGRMD